MIDQDPAHELRRDTKKVRPALQIDLALIDQSEIGLVYEGGRLQGVADPLIRQLASGDATELLVDQRQELTECTPITTAPISEKRSHIVRRGHLSLSGLENHSAIR